MIIKAVIEEILEDSVVLLLGEKEKEIVIRKNQFQRSKDYKVGDWVDVILEGENIISIRLNQEETDKIKERIEEKMEKLRKRMNSK